MNDSCVGYVNPRDYDFVVNKMREYCRNRGMIEVPVQSRLSILAACEDPGTLSTFNYVGRVWPLPQTGQMWLEYELLKDKDGKESNGYYSISTSYRNEPEPVPGRHDFIFNMFEFELPGGMDELIEFEKGLLEYLGYGPSENYAEGTYAEVCEAYNSKEVGHHEESQLYKDHGPVYFVKGFPEESDPFWNMKRSDGVAQKIDVILSGMETFGSAERSCDTQQMRESFDTITGGTYARTLYSHFTKERVEEEMTNFLNMNFFPRCGGGIGITRLIKSMRKEGLME